MRLRLLLLAALLASSTPALAQDFAYLRNDSLDFGASQIEAFTTGDILATEWLAVRLTNSGDTVFNATEVQLFVGSPSADDLLLYPQCAGRTPRTQVRVEIKVWEDDGPTLMNPGTEIVHIGAEEDDEELQVSVNAINRVPLGGILPLEPGEHIRVGMRFPEGAGACTGSLMQDSSRILGGNPRNYLQGTIIGGILCDDPNFRWRDFNGDCDSIPPGVGGRGNLAIRLARETGGGPIGTPDTGTGTPDVGTGTPDVGAPDAEDVATTPEAFAVTRVTPSMAPSNVDTLLTIEGTGFTNELSVRIGPSTLAGMVVGEGSANGTLTAGLPVGLYDLIATQGGETQTLASAFQVTDEVYEAPEIDDVSVSSALEGTSVDVRIDGANFHPDADVYFGNASGLGIDVDEDGNSLFVRSPNTLPPGVYDIEIENPDGQSDLLRSAWQVTSLANPAPDGCAIGGTRRRADALLVLALVAVVVFGRRRR